MTLCVRYGMIVQKKLPWANLAGAKVLVTGAAGFLPAYMVGDAPVSHRHVSDKAAMWLAWCGIGSGRASDFRKPCWWRS